GVTRDRVSALIRFGDRFFELVDTGGMGIQDSDNLTAQVEQQIESAIEDASVILFIVDGRDGLAPLDQEVARRLRYVSKPVLCVANKCDHEGIDDNASEFYRLGRGKLICVSARQNRNRDELLALITERLPPADEEEEEASKPIAMKLAIV